jgi:hypothetical protein
MPDIARRCHSRSALDRNWPLLAQDGRTLFHNVKHSTPRDARDANSMILFS